MNNEEIGHPSDDITDDDYNNIEDHKTQHVDNELQSNSHLEDTNKTNDGKITNNY